MDFLKISDANTKTLAESYNHNCGIQYHTDIEKINKFNMDVNLFQHYVEIKFSKDHSARLIYSSIPFASSKVNSLIIFHL